MNGLDDLGVEMPRLSIEGPLPARYADLTSLRLDLGHVRRAAEAAAALDPSDGESPDGVVLRSLWESAIISYRRSFTTGRSHLNQPRAGRPTLNGALDQLEPRLRDAHGTMLEQANQHIAHRVNSLQQVKVMVFLNAPPLPRAVAGLGPSFMHYLGPLTEQVETLLELVEWFVALVDAELNALWENLMEEMSQRVDWCYENAEPKYSTT